MNTTTVMQSKTGGFKFPIIRRPLDGIVCVSVSPENESMLLSTSPSAIPSTSPSTSPSTGDEIKIMTRSEYASTIHAKRSAFLKHHFSPVLSEISRKLSEDSQLMKACKVEATFPVPEPFDRMKVELMITEYFRYLEYDVIVEDSTYDYVKITIQ